MQYLLLGPVRYTSSKYKNDIIKTACEHISLQLYPGKKHISVFDVSAYPVSTPILLRVCLICYTILINLNNRQGCKQMVLQRRRLGTCFSIYDCEQAIYASSVEIDSNM